MLKHLGNAVIQLCGRGFERTGRLVHRVFQRLQIRQRVCACHGFDATHTGRNTTFGHDFEQANVACRVDVGAPAQLAA